MTRRLRLMGLASVAFVLPACVPMPIDQTSRTWPHGSPHHRPLPGVAVPTPAEGATEQFAENRPSTTPTKNAPMIPLPGGDAPRDIETVDYKPKQLEPARIGFPGVRTEPSTPIVEPLPDKEGIIRSDWPKLKEPPIGESLPTLKPVPVLEKPTEGPSPGPTLVPMPAMPGPSLDLTPPLVAPPPVIPPVKAPEVLPPSVMGVPNHQTRSSPANDVAIPAIRTTEHMLTSAHVAHDSPLIQAIRALQENRPSDAASAFRAHDPATQQLLLALLPPVLHLADGKLLTMKADEVDVLLDQLTRVPNMLRTRASLQVNKLLLCREVHCFAKVEPFQAKHSFRSGDMVHLYVELANFSCPPDAKGGYAINLASALELRDAAGNLVWRADPKEEPDHVTSTPMDYYRAYRFSVPNLAGGIYTLALKLVDRPTGREVRKTIDFRVGAK